MTTPLLPPEVRAHYATGPHRNPTGRPKWFTTAYFHHPEDLPAEVVEAGFEVVETVGVEGGGRCPTPSRAGLPPGWGSMGRP